MVPASSIPRWPWQQKRYLSEGSKKTFMTSDDSIGPSLVQPGAAVSRLENLALPSLGAGKALVRLFPMDDVYRFLVKCNEIGNKNVRLSMT
jgi:hypothetical protein